MGLREDSVGRRGSVGYSELRGRLGNVSYWEACISIVEDEAMLVTLEASLL